MTSLPNGQLMVDGSVYFNSYCNASKERPDGFLFNKGRSFDDGRLFYGGAYITALILHIIQHKSIKYKKFSAYDSLKALFIAQKITT